MASMRAGSWPSSSPFADTGDEPVSAALAAPAVAAGRLGRRPLPLVARALGHGNSLPPRAEGLWPRRRQREPGPGGEELAEHAEQVLVVVGCCLQVGAHGGEGLGAGEAGERPDILSWIFTILRARSATLLSQRYAGVVQAAQELVRVSTQARGEVPGFSLGFAPTGPGRPAGWRPGWEQGEYFVKGGVVAARIALARPGSTARRPALAAAPDATLASMSTPVIWSAQAENASASPTDLRCRKA